jgi:hypothetical protein
MSCRNGRENSPISWFACEKKNKNNTDEPLPGSVLILGIDRGHGMPTGHVAYVEEVILAGPSSTPDFQIPTTPQMGLKPGLRPFTIGYHDRMSHGA